MLYLSIYVVSNLENLGKLINLEKLVKNESETRISWERKSLKKAIERQERPRIWRDIYIHISISLSFITSITMTTTSTRATQTTQPASSKKSIFSQSTQDHEVDSQLGPGNDIIHGKRRNPRSERKKLHSATSTINAKEPLDQEKKKVTQHFLFTPSTLKDVQRSQALQEIAQARMRFSMLQIRDDDLVYWPQRILDLDISTVKYMSNDKKRHWNDIIWNTP